VLQLHDTNEQLGKSSRILSGMMRRSVTTILIILILLILLLIIIITIVINFYTRYKQKVKK